MSQYMDHKVRREQVGRSSSLNNLYLIFVVRNTNGVESLLMLWNMIEL